jgi:hypothetical protein
MKEKNLLQISNIMFKDRSKWSSVTDEEKSAFFFIFNRFFSKRYPELSQKLNLKSCDPVMGMNLWFNFMSNKSYPQWFWSKSEKKIKESEDEYDYKKYDLTIAEWELLKLYYSEEVQEELKWIKQLQK